MNLKNLMYATMVACAFASCSKDDVPEIPTPGTDGDVTLSLKVAAPLSTATAPLSTVAGALSTKSIGSVTEGDADTKITSLTTYVFDVQTKTLEAVGTTKVSDTEVQTTGIKAGTKKVIVLANVTPEKAVPGTTTYDDFIGQSLENLENEKNGNLSMNSQVFDVVLKAGVINYLGYTDVPAGGNKVLNTANAAVSETPVKLFRNVAKVVLKKITYSPKNNDRYPNAALEIENVYILNGRSTTNIVGAAGAPWGTTMATTSAYENGMSATDYEAWVAKFLATNKPALFSYLTGNYAEAAFASYVGAPNVTLDKQNLFIPKNDQGAPTTVDQFYVYENTLAKVNTAAVNANTLLVVKGKFKYDGNPNPESRYYTVAVGYDSVVSTDIPADSGMSDATYQDLSGRADLKGVIRNMQYNIELTVSGPGYTTPVGPTPEDDTFLQVKVVVVPFGVVEQDVEIE